MNLLFVFSDQHRAQATGYAGDPNVNTPNMDRLKDMGTNFPYAISNCPVCSPNRACLLTGQYPLTHKLIYNDIPLKKDSPSIGQAFKDAGYDTGYIGKWHISGKGRSNFIEKEDRFGFDYFKVLECTHNYNRSPYYDNEDRELKEWEDYDVFAQSKDAIKYINDRKGSTKPFFLMLSWGPPHDPYHEAPAEYRKGFEGKEIKLRPNVPEHTKPYAKNNLPGYYAHIEAIDSALGMLIDAIDEETILVYSSDHGDMLGSQGLGKKQKPWDESIRIPFLMKAPNIDIKSYDGILNTPDIGPTLMGLCQVPIPKEMEGRDLSRNLLNNTVVDDDYAFISNVAPFGEWARCFGGREWRGIRNRQYTYVIDKSGPWLLYDNEKDPYQMKNLVGLGKEIEKDLDSLLMKVLKEKDDQFLFGDEYAKILGIKLNENGTVAY